MIKLILILVTVMAVQAVGGMTGPLLIFMGAAALVFTYDALRGIDRWTIDDSPNSGWPWGGQR